MVAHFYMDPEVQGVLAAAQARWPHIHISDSLVMADSAVEMAEGGCQAVTVLGVDFMSENVRAILDEAGYKDVQVSAQPAAPSLFTHPCQYTSGILSDMMLAWLSITYKGLFTPSTYAV